MNGESTASAEPLQVAAENGVDTRERLLVRRGRLEDEPPGFRPDRAGAIGE